MNAPAELALNRRPPLREASLWLVAGIVVFVAHAAFAYLLTDIDPPVAQDALEEALEIDLAPLPVSLPETVQSEVLAKEQPADTVEPVEETTETVEAEPDEIVEETPVETAQAQPEPETEQPVTETVEPETAEEEPAEPEPLEEEPVKSEPVEEEVLELETPEVVTPEVVLSVPEPRPEKPAEKKVERKKPAPKEAAPKKPEIVKDKKPAERPKRVARQPPASVRSSASSSAPKIDPSRWNNAVRAAIARRAGAVRGMRGTVRVSFVVSSSGAIVSASVTGSSGNDRLDKAALGMVRAARVPAPPEGIGGSRHSFAIPLTFR